jgi:dTDP-4-amino-4,6-dideoxygalactose transaminase
VPAPIVEIAALGVPVIEDCAQAPGASYRGKPVGTLGRIGGFSLNVHKTIQTGEGGVMVTDDEELALRMRLIRNHGETAVESLGLVRLENTFGGNTRMTEIEAAIASVQLRRLEELTQHRLMLAAALDREMASLPGLRPPRALDPDSRHVYYFYAMRYDEKRCGLPRGLFLRAVQAEGIPLRSDYARPVYWEPIFQKGIAIGKEGFPFRNGPGGTPYRYPRGLCPAAEGLFERELLFGRFCRWPLTQTHVDQVLSAFHKILENTSALLEFAPR